MKEEILARLDLLAAKLGVAASYLFSLYVKQARVEAIQDGVMFFVGILCFFLARYTFGKTVKATDDNEGGWILATIVAGIAAAAFIMLPCFTIWTELFNPEYWAFKEILSDLHGK